MPNKSLKLLNSFSNFADVKYKNKKSYRLRNFDYSRSAAYFVTVCTKNMGCHFGEVVNGKMKLSDIGIAAAKYWKEIGRTYIDVKLDEWVVMPNHVHGIIMIVKEDFSRNTPRRVPTGIHPLIKDSLSSIINHFKGNLKRWCNKNGHDYFNWQPRFYDHIIRNEKSLYQIREYILFNPVKWGFEKNQGENLFL